MEKGDTLKAVKLGRGRWVIRTESRREIQPMYVKDRTLYTYWPDGRRVIEISGQNLLGYWRTKRAALKVIKQLEEARNQ